MWFSLLRLPPSDPDTTAQVPWAVPSSRTAGKSLSERNGQLSPPTPDGEPLQRSHITKHVGGILETLQVYIGIEAATARPRRIPGFELIEGKRGSSRITRSANDHQVAAGLFECFFRCGDLILWAKTFALYEIIPRPERPREQFPGLLRARFVRFRLGNHMVGAEGAPALGLVIRISGRTTPPALVR